MTPANRRSFKAHLVIAAVFVTIVVAAWAVNVWVHS